MNFYLTRAFAQKLKDERNNKTNKQLRRDNVSRVELPRSSNGDGETVYRAIFKWLRG
jgi:hypothetical protein